MDVELEDAAPGRFAAASAETSPINRLWALACIPLGHMVVDIITNMLPIALPIIKANFNLSFAQVGILATSLNITSSVAQPVFGTLSDRWRTNWFVPVGLFWVGAGIGLIGFMPGYWSLLVLIFLAGFGSAAFHPKGMQAMAEAAPRSKGLAISSFVLGGNIGFAVGPLVGALLLITLGNEDLRWAAVLWAPALVMALTLWRVQARMGTSQAPAHRSTAHVNWERRTLVSVVVLALLVALRSWSHSGLVIYFPLFLKAQGYSLSLASRFLFILLMAGAVGGLAGGYISDFVGRKKVIAVSLLLFPPFMALFLKDMEGPWAMLLLPLAGMALLASFSVIVALTHELMPARTGLASGLMLGLAFGAGSIGVTISGVISDIYGITFNIWLLALLTLAAAPLLFAVKEPPRY